MPLEIRGAHFFNSECTISAGKIAIWSSLVGPQRSWALVHRTTCTTCMAATAMHVVSYRRKSILR